MLQAALQQLGLMCCVQVYVTVYADGPTRVLQFSDEPTLANSGYDLSIVDLAARTKQACQNVQCNSMLQALCLVHTCAQLSCCCA